MGAWLSAENGQAVNFLKFVLLFFEKGQLCRNLQRHGENTLYFPT